ncbi:hypothetical protein JOE44_000107 [Chryseobacterium sp. PvR013]|nr:hypothetical protein [Chryseobacterium sp. PvR013]
MILKQSYCSYRQAGAKNFDKNRKVINFEL